MRAFIAIELPDEFRHDVAAVSRRLSTTMSGRFLPYESYHVTIAFLGEIGEAQATDAVCAIEDAAEACLGEVPLKANGLGKFGRASDATLWLGLQRDPGLMAVADQVRAKLDERGLSYDSHPFLPHISLARRARLPKGDLPPLAFPVDAQAERLTLFKSSLSREGATYKPLHTVRIG